MSAHAANPQLKYQTEYVFCHILGHSIIFQITYTGRQGIT